MCTEPELAYIAGFFDGEGCITSHLAREGHSRLRVSITQSSPAVLTFIQDKFGGQIRPQRKCWELSWCGTRALPLLVALLPHMIVKREQAQLAIEWISLGTGQRGFHLLPAHKTRRLAIDAELKQLKHVA